MRFSLFSVLAAVVCDFSTHPVLARDVNALQLQPFHAGVENSFYHGIQKRAGGPARPPSRPGSHGPNEIPDPPESSDPDSDGILEDGTPAAGTASEHDDSLFDLGSYDDNFEALYMNFDGAMDPLFSKIFDFLSSAEPEFYATVNPYANSPPSPQNPQPFQNGPRPSGQPLEFPRTITSPASLIYTSTFAPAHPTAVCGAYASIVNYCGGSANWDCACYSSTYWVPDQFNSLAAGCAAFMSNCPDEASTYWCDVAQSAWYGTANCPPTDISGNPGVKFAAYANTPAPSAPQQVPASTTVAAPSTPNSATVPSATGGNDDDDDGGDDGDDDDDDDDDGSSTVVIGSVTSASVSMPTMTTASETSALPNAAAGRMQGMPGYAVGCALLVSYLWVVL